MTSPRSGADAPAARFSTAELDYLLAERRLGRLATIDASGQPHVVGGIAISAGYGYAAPSWIALALVAGAILCGVAGRAADRPAAGAPRSD